MDTSLSSTNPFPFKSSRSKAASIALRFEGVFYLAWRSRAFICSLKLRNTAARIIFIKRKRPSRRKRIKNKQEAPAVSRDPNNK